MAKNPRAKNADKRSVGEASNASQPNERTVSTANPGIEAQMGDIAKAVAAIHDVAKAVAITQSVTLGAALDVAKAAAAVQDVAKATAVQHYSDASSMEHTAKSAAAHEDAGKAPAVQDVAKAVAAIQHIAKAAISDVAKAAVMNDIAKAVATTQVSQDPDYYKGALVWSLDRMAETVQATDDPALLHQMLHEAGRMHGAYEDVASKARTIAEMTRQRIAENEAQRTKASKDAKT